MSEDSIEPGRPVSPSPLVEKFNEIEDSPEKARDFFKAFIRDNYIQRSPKTGRKLDAGRARTLKEASRLRKLYPEVYKKLFSPSEE